LYYFDIAQPSSVSGIITDASTNLPLEGASINLGASYSAISNSLGYYMMEDVENGDYTLSCELEGYETYSTEIGVSGAEVIDIEMELISAIDHSSVFQNKISISSHPNPFRSETTISYSIPSANRVRIEIYNTQGEIIKTLVNKYQNKGNYSFAWNKESESSIEAGIYFCRITTGKFSSIEKMIILK
ncbi:MAG: T9SS type A sorting domain-containing protein, partial [Bacteroidales bacterium]|nr:T9SS type A sorting domain-containing protein [Bacteroidales bacterium]